MPEDVKTDQRDVDDSRYVRLELLNGRPLTFAQHLYRTHLYRTPCSAGRCW